VFVPKTLVELALWVKVVLSLLANNLLLTPLVGLAASTNGYHCPYFGCDYKDTYYFVNLWSEESLFNVLLYFDQGTSWFITLSGWVVYFIYKVSLRLHLHSGWSSTWHKLKWRLVQVKCFTHSQILKFKPVERQMCLVPPLGGVKKGRWLIMFGPNRLACHLLETPIQASRVTVLGLLHLQHELIQPSSKSTRRGYSISSRIIQMKLSYWLQNCLSSEIWEERPWDLKLKSGGRGRPLGRRVFGSLSSSKKGWMQASNCRPVTCRVSWQVSSPNHAHRLYNFISTYSRAAKIWGVLQKPRHQVKCFWR